MPPRKPIYLPVETASLFQVPPAELHAVFSYLWRERRQAPRYELKLPLELIRRGDEKVSEKGETRNLSSKGILFQAQSRARIGELVEYVVTLTTAPRPGQVVRLRCSGRVVRCVDEKEIAATLERYKFVRARTARR